MTKSLKTLLTQIVNKLNGLNKAGTIGYPTYSSMRNCTGTVATNFLQLYQSESGGACTICGRIAITSFVRSGANPGVNLTLPSAIPTPTKTTVFYVGFRAENPRENVQLNLTANSRTILLFTTETYQNAQNGTLTFSCNGTFYTK